MEELNQILKREEEKNQEVATAKKQAQKEIESKRQKLAAKLADEDILTDQDKQKVFDYKEKEMAEIKKSSDNKLKKGLADLKQKEEVNLDKATSYVVGKLIGDAD